MAEADKSDLTQLTVQLLSAYLANNVVAREELADLITTTKAALAGEVAVPVVPEPEFVPVVSVRKSLASPDHILSMIDGKPYRMLKRHLASHGLTPAEYRARYELPKNYPMVAKSYSDQRRATAERIGLGTRKAVSTPVDGSIITPESEAASPAAADNAAKPASHTRKPGGTAAKKAPKGTRTKAKTVAAATAPTPASLVDETVTPPTDPISETPSTVEAAPETNPAPSPKAPRKKAVSAAEAVSSQIKPSRTKRAKADVSASAKRKPRAATAADKTEGEPTDPDAAAKVSTKAPRKKSAATVAASSADEVSPPPKKARRPRKAKDVVDA